MLKVHTEKLEKIQFNKVVEFINERALDRISNYLIKDYAFKILKKDDCYEIIHFIDKDEKQVVSIVNDYEVLKVYNKEATSSDQLNYHNFMKRYFQNYEDDLKDYLESKKENEKED